MRPVVTIAEMQAIDRAAPDPIDTLIGRAGAAVAAAALDMLGGAYGRRVWVIAGPGHNGADGRVAASLLRRRGVRVHVAEIAGPAPSHAPDLVIDAAVGTGISRPYTAPEVAAPVLAVDVPSGVHGDSGLVMGSAVRATRTVTFAAATPGLLFADGPSHAGRVEVVDIGLATPDASIHLVEDVDVATWIPTRSRETHKWDQAVLIVAGSPGMTGAASLAAEAAARAGAGMVRLVSPGVGHASDVGREVVTIDVDEHSWADAVLEASTRDHAAVVGPGLGTSMLARHQIRQVVQSLRVPVVVDGDGITALGRNAADMLRERRAPTVVTPHDGEFERLTGARPGRSGIGRIDAARRAADDLGAVVLLKGPTTVVAAPGGQVLLAAAGDERLASAGTGDVLAGVIGALLAGGVAPAAAAASAAHLHGLAGRTGPRPGTIASDVAAGLPTAIATVVRSMAPEPAR